MGSHINPTKRPMKKYDTYKPSGIEWIGEIPSHWNEVSIKWASEIFAGGTPSKDKEEYWFGGTIPWLNSGTVNQGYVVEPSEYITDLGYEKSSAKWIPKDSLLIALAGQGKTKGMVAQLGIDATCNQSMAAIITNRNLESRYLLYWLQANYQNIRNLGGGDLRDGLNLEMIGSIKSPIPAKEEQLDISNYLDKKTVEIDQLIADKKKLLELYEQEKTTIINQAVTKGINPTAPMKDSGIEWLGEIPEHWEVKRIDLISNIVRGNTGFKKDELLDAGEYVALQYGKTYKVNEINESFKFFVNSEFYKSNQIVQFGDVILISTSETVEDLGHSSFYGREDIGLLGGEQILLRPINSSVSGKYLYYSSKVFCVQLRKFARGIKVFRFNTDNLKEMYSIVPPLKEQQQIVHHIETECALIDTKITKTEKLIELLTEYRTALISEVVTGKIKVID
jgi:type I restriction enzyme, S subunit